MGTIDAFPIVRRSAVANQPETKTWMLEVIELLERAAEVCAAHDIDVEPFMRGAYAAYLDARPGLKERLEDLQLEQQLDELRKHGRVAQA